MCPAESFRPPSPTYPLWANSQASSLSRHHCSSTSTTHCAAEGRATGVAWPPRGGERSSGASRSG
eukprot:1252950-Alexandrium_andersonii.AAC.1